MSEKILFYKLKEPYGEFSNFRRDFPIVALGDDWPSTEHLFQAMKFIGTDLEHMNRIRLAKTPREAADLGRDRNHPLRPDWEEVKVNMMWLACRIKFGSYPELKKLLIETGDAEIIEHTTNDNIWADGGDGSGQNLLGKVLMDIRSEFQHAIKTDEYRKRLEKTMTTVILK